MTIYTRMLNPFRSVYWWCVQEIVLSEVPKESSTYIQHPHETTSVTYSSSLVSPATFFVPSIQLVVSYFFSDPSCSKTTENDVYTSDDHNVFKPIFRCASG